MKKLLIFALAALALTACGSSSSTPSEGTYYYWGAYDKGGSYYTDAVYKLAKAQSAENICNLVCTYENMVSNPGGTRGVVPPGVCAEYGYLLALPQTAEAFASAATDEQKKVFGDVDYVSYFPSRSAALFQKEIELYPESRTFIEPLLKRIAQQ